MACRRWRIVFGYYLVHRALVRAKVAQLRALQATGVARSEALATAARYLRVAERFAQPPRPALLITHGLPGSGKTTLTQSLVETAGAVRVRADIERKRLAGLAPLASSRSLPGRGLYTPAMNDATQARLLAAAGAALDGGVPVIVDATFIRRRSRDEARECARQHGALFVILCFAVEPERLRERVRRRAAGGLDASEADEAVLDAQLRALEPLAAGELAEAFDVPGASAPEPPVDVDWGPVLRRLAGA
jgi:predicted kinase